MIHSGSGSSSDILKFSEPEKVSGSGTDPNYFKMIHNFKKVSYNKSKRRINQLYAIPLKEQYFLYNLSKGDVPGSNRIRIYNTGQNELSDRKKLFST